MKYQLILLISISTFVVTGCSKSENDSVAVEPQPEEQPAEVVKITDDITVVTALTDLGASFQKNSDGLITEVSLIGTSASDADLEQLGKLTKLTSLRLNETNISDAGMETVGKLTNLTNLDLRGCSISNDSMTA